MISGRLIEMENPNMSKLIEGTERFVTGEALVFLSVSLLTVALVFIPAPIPQIISAACFVGGIVRREKLGSQRLAVLGVLGVAAVLVCSRLMF